MKALIRKWLGIPEFVNYEQHKEEYEKQVNSVFTDLSEALNTSDYRIALRLSYSDTLSSESKYHAVGTLKIMARDIILNEVDKEMKIRAEHAIEKAFRGVRSKIDEIKSEDYKKEFVASINSLQLKSGDS